MFLETIDRAGDSTIDPSAVDLGELLRDIPDDAVEAFRKAAENSRSGDYERAAENLEEAIEIAPDFYDAQNALGGLTRDWDAGRTRSTISK